MRLLSVAAPTRPTTPIHLGPPPAGVEKVGLFGPGDFEPAVGWYERKAPASQVQWDANADAPGYWLLYKLVGFDPEGTIAYEKTLLPGGRILKLRVNESLVVYL